MHVHLGVIKLKFNVKPLLIPQNCQHFGSKIDLIIEASGLEFGTQLGLWE